ncbi:MAG TPA: hypothetical protein VGC66_01320 [Pyrinomonadaceae bacterium]
MRDVNKAAYSLLLILALMLPVAAQNKEQKKPVKSDTKSRIESTENELMPEQQLALTILGQLFEAAKGIEDEQVKIKTQAQISDLLWPYDEPSAREQFEKTFRAIDPAKLPKPQNTGSSATSSQLTLSPVVQLRSEVLKLVSKHDPALAEKLIKSVVAELSNKESDSASRSGEDQTNQSELYLQAAMSIANTDPGRAAQLAKLSFNGGMRTSLLGVLLAIRQKSPAIADNLFNSALTVARLDTGHVATNIRILAPYVLPDFGGISTERAGYNMSVTDQQRSPTISRFLNFAYDLISQQANAAQAGSPTTEGQAIVAIPNVADYFTAQQLLPFFSRYLPEKAPTFRVCLDMIYRVVKDQGGDLVAKTTQANTVEEALKDAEAAQDSMQKDLLYFRAALLSLNGSEFDQALSISEKVKDADFRAGLDSIIRAQATVAATMKNDIDLAFRYAKGVSDVRQRASLLGKIARALIDKKDMVRAREVLDEAEKLVAKADEGLDRAQAMLIIADAKTRLDPAQGFEMMETAVKEFNRADSSTDEKKPAGGSILSMMMSKVMRLGTPDFDQSFPLLGRADFNRALQLAQTFKKKDRSILAQLSVCRGVLTKRDRRG